MSWPETPGAPPTDFTLWHVKQNLQVRGRQKGGQEGQSFLSPELDRQADEPPKVWADPRQKDRPLSCGQIIDSQIDRSPQLWIDLRQMPLNIYKLWADHRQTGSPA